MLKRGEKMLFYGVYYKKVKEFVMYYVIKICSYIKTILPQKSEKRRSNKLLYDSVYKRTFGTLLGSNSIPEGKYCQPFGIITSDLILREDIPKLQKGVSKLIKRLYTHKYLSATRSIEEIINQIEHMDPVLGTWYSNTQIGRFDFRNHKVLNRYIDYFDVYIRNVNSSYLGVEFHIFLCDRFVKKQISLINSNYSEKRGYITQSLTQRARRKNGLKKKMAVVNYNKHTLKSDRLFENTVILEWLFFNEMKKYFPLFFHGKDIIPPAISLFKTDISYKEENLDNFWHSLGVSKYMGTFINEREKIFFGRGVTERYKEISSGSYIYIINDIEIADGQAGITKEDIVIQELACNLDGVTFLFEFLNCMNTYASKEIIKYRSKLNLIKLNQNKLSDLLKIRYQYEKALDCFKRYVNDDIWEFAIEEITDYFGVCKGNCYKYEYVTNLALACKERIEEQFLLWEKDYEAKVNVLQHLDTYKNEFKNRTLNFVMLFLTLLTVIFIIFPDWGEEVGNLLEEAYRTIREVISAYMHK